MTGPRNKTEVKRPESPSTADLDISRDCITDAFRRRSTLRCGARRKGTRHFLHEHGLYQNFLEAAFPQGRNFVWKRVRRITDQPDAGSRGVRAQDRCEQIAAESGHSNIDQHRLGSNAFQEIQRGLGIGKCAHPEPTKLRSRLQEDGPTRVTARVQDRCPPLRGCQVSMHSRIDRKCEAFARDECHSPCRALARELVLRAPTRSLARLQRW